MCRLKQVEQVVQDLERSLCMRAGVTQLTCGTHPASSWGRWPGCRGGS